MSNDNLSNLGIGLFGVVIGTIFYFVGNFYFESTGGIVGFAFCQLLALIAIPVGIWMTIGGILPINNESKKDAVSAILTGILFFIVGLYLLGINIIVVAIISGLCLILGIWSLLGK